LYYFSKATATAGQNPNQGEDRMSGEFIWKEKYSVGNATIDQQHKELFEIGNRLSEIAAVYEIKSLIMHLFEYTRKHFAYEEGIMKQMGFPLQEEHLKLHEDLISQLSEMSKNSFKTDEAVFNFKMFFLDWLIDHIMVEDNKYVRFRDT
jgi:hemerythrin